MGRSNRSRLSGRVFEVVAVWAAVVWGAAFWGAVLGTASPLAAATVLEKTVTVEIQSAERQVRSTKLRVQIDDMGDVDDWGIYAVYLDDNVKLERFRAAIIYPDGRHKTVGRKQQDSVEFSGAGTAYDSRHYHVAEFPGMQVGSRLEIDVQVIERPYFSADQMLLWGGDEVRSLNVTLKSQAAGFRWRLDGPAEGLEVVEQDTGAGLRGVELRGVDLKAIDPARLAAGGGDSYPMLRWAWGDAAAWPGVAGWYRQLLSELPRDDASIRTLAAELTKGKETPREQLEALLTYVRQKVRYVAVQVGIGGYLPSTPQETLERKWGDCKDKSLLLIDLLRARGITAYPALVLLANDQRIDTEFPSAAQFNHLIVVIPESEVAFTTEDPTSEGFLFLDPTQTRGGVRYLHSGVQDQDALVVLEKDGKLVATPRRPQYESYYLAFNLEVDAAGKASGRAGLLLYGGVAASFLESMESAPPERTAEDALKIFEQILPSGKFQGVGWEEVDGPIPAARIALQVEIDGLLSGLQEGASFQLPSLQVMPSPRFLDVDDPALRYALHQKRTSWDLTLPGGACLPAEGERVEENSLGSFRQTIQHLGEQQVMIDRVGETRRKFFDAQDLDSLQSLALAEHRTKRRRIRLKCASETPSE